MKILFIGSVYFSKLALIKILELKADVVGIITKEASSFNSDFCDLSSIAQDHVIPFKYVRDINHPNNISWIQNWKPDIIFCFGWSSLLKDDILNIPKHGIIGFHPALLPFNKGRHPLIWAKVLGLNMTGSTFFFMDRDADTGDILSQANIPILFEEDVNDLYNKMISTALEQIEDFMPKLINGNYERIQQPKEIGNSWRKRVNHDGFIDFRMNSISICNLVRGLTKPYAGAHCTFKGMDYKVWKVELGRSQLKNIEPGKVLSVHNNYIEVKTYDGSIFLIEHDFQVLPLVDEYII